MELETYRSIMNSIQRFKGSSRECRKKLLKDYPHLPPSTLGSIIGTHCQYKNMSNHSYVRRSAGQLYDKYRAAVDAREETGILVRLASEVEFSPSQLARFILEQHYQKIAELAGKPELVLSKQELQKMMKDTTRIEDKDLAYEIYLCMILDDQSGPYSDQIKNILGYEYEIKLHECVRSVGLVFKTEKDLYAKGYDKTPDVKLETPVAVDGFVINWIESKALFGNERQHLQYVKDQYQSYWNRFGPGLVIYWFSYLNTIIDPSEKRFIVKDSFPTNLMFLDPDLISAPTFSATHNKTKL